MNRHVQQLKYSVQTLALPVTAQLRLHQSHTCRVAELANIFAYWQKRVLQENKLTNEQTAVLDRLAQQLTELCCSEKEPKWADTSLRRSRPWQQVRHTAREVLLLFDWPLDVPPVAHQ